MRQRLEAKAAQWRVRLDEILETSTSLVGFGVRDQQRVVLKLIKQADDEVHSGRVLRAFGGNSAARVYEEETGAVLLERLDPGDQLVSLVRRGEDEEATRILAQVISGLAHHEPPEGCPTVADWGRGFSRYLKGSHRQIPGRLVQEAKNVYEQLASSQRTTMLLHGDLQHYNVLFDRQRGWLAIDPKGVVGELEFELGALLRNPIEQPELFIDRVTVERRLDILSALLPIDGTRALEWSFAQAVLSAIWNVEDGHGVEIVHPALRLANTLTELRRNQPGHVHGGVGHSES